MWGPVRCGRATPAVGRGRRSVGAASKTPTRGPTEGALLRGPIKGFTRFYISFVRVLLGFYRFYTGFY